MILQYQMKIFQQPNRNFFLQKQPLVKSLTDIVLLGFSLILLPGMFISYCTMIYFFVKIFFECLCFSKYDIRMFLFVSQLRNRPSINNVRNQGNGGGSPKMFTDAYRGRGVSPFMCTYALTLSLFMFLSYDVWFYLQKINLIFIQKGCACQKWLFFSNEINFSCNEISYFYFKLLLQNLRYTLNFIVTPYFEKILCSVARRFI